MGANFLDKDGQLKPVIMGSYGIGVGRLLACVAEEHNDEDGLSWPISIAPYHVHLLQLGQEGEAVTVAEKLYDDLTTAGIETLLDDRDETPGVKFKDADLIGIPIRITVGERSLKRGGPEIKLRREKSSINISPESAVDHVAMLIGQLQAEIASSVVTVPFEE
jgi:prolyl-tRNA synthetase